MRTSPESQVRNLDLPVLHSGDTTPCRMTGVTLHSHVRYKEMPVILHGLCFQTFESDTCAEFAQAREGPGLKVY